MTVKELKEMLGEYPDEMEVIVGRYSDYCIVSKNACSIVKGVQEDFWVMRYHCTMNTRGRADVKNYLYLDGEY